MSLLDKLNFEGFSQQIERDAADTTRLSCRTPRSFPCRHRSTAACLRPENLQDLKLVVICWLQRSDRIDLP